MRSHLIVFYHMEILHSHYLGIRGHSVWLERSLDGIRVEHGNNGVMIPPSDR